jgi:hypothetical protein
MVTTSRPASRPATRPDRTLAASKRERYCDTGEASRLLDGLISAGVLRQMALGGEIRGAIKVRHRVLIPRHIVPTLVRELEFSAVPSALPRPQPTTFDAPSRWARG